MGKSTISTGPFSIAMLNYQRIYPKAKSSFHLGMVESVLYTAQIQMDWVNEHMLGIIDVFFLPLIGS